MIGLSLLPGQAKTWEHSTKKRAIVAILRRLDRPGQSQASFPEVASAVGFNSHASAFAHVREFWDCEKAMEYAVRIESHLTAKGIRLYGWDRLTGYSKGMHNEKARRILGIGGGFVEFRSAV